MNIKKNKYIHFGLIQGPFVGEERLLESTIASGI